MSVEYSAMIIVGLPRGDVEGFEELIDDDVLEFCPAYYDAGEGVVGISVIESGDYSFAEIDMEDVLQKVKDAKEEFFNATGLQGNVYLSTRGS